MSSPAEERKPTRIPIAAAKRIAKEHGYEQVVIMARHPEREPGFGDGREHVTTYGTTILHCDVAARMGNKLKRILGWPESYCQDKPARVRRKDAKP